MLMFKLWARRPSPIGRVCGAREPAPSPGHAQLRLKTVRWDGSRSRATLGRGGRPFRSVSAIIRHFAFGKSLLEAPA